MTDTGWHGWQDDNGDAMFVADGAKHPLLVQVTGQGDQEIVLAEFASVETASIFQDWLDRSFEETALANQRLSVAVNGGELPQARHYGHHEDSRIPGYVAEDDE